MSNYSVNMEISGATAMWTRPDTGDAPMSYPVPTFAGVKGIFESILWLKNARVVPTRVEICSPIIYHTYTTNYGGPLRKQASVTKGASYQLIATVLVNVCYKLFASVDPGQQSHGTQPANNGAHAYQDMFIRRLKRGQCHSVPFLGWKEFVPDYVGPLRAQTQKLGDLNLTIPSLLKTCFPYVEGNLWQPTFLHNVVIQEGVLQYDK